MNASASALLLVLGAAACRDANPPAPPRAAAGAAFNASAIADLSRRVRRLAGPTLLECGVWLEGDGTVPINGFNQAITCGRSAATRRQPFWVAAHASGGVTFHELHAHGLFAGIDGVIHRFTYKVDLRVTGGPGPEFIVARCSEPTMSTWLGTFRCRGEQVP